MRGTPGTPVWQRNYYEHVIRDEGALHAIRRYIVENPLRWHLDRYNADREGPDPLAAEIWRMMQEAARQRPVPKGKADALRRPPKGEDEPGGAER
jgi:hypothetical protein